MSVESYKTKKGTRWRVRYTVAGKRTDKRGFALKRDAQAWEAARLLQPTSSLYHGPNRTIDQLYRTMVERRGRAWRPSWARVVGSKYRTHIKPSFGGLPAKAITRDMCEQWVDRLGKSLAAHTIRDTAGILRDCLQVAVDDHEIAENPMSRVRLPKVLKRRERRTYLTLGQLMDLAREAGNSRYDGAQHEAIVLLLGLTGLRWSEMCGLQAGDIDLARHRIDVRRDCVFSGGWVIGPPKNGKARTVPLPRIVEDRLRPLMVGEAASDWLFHGSGGSPHPTYQSYARTGRGRWWQQAVERSGVPRVTPHDLRHTAASIAVSLGGSVLVVQRMLGHSSAAMTLDVYADLFDADLDQVRGRLDDAVEMWAKCGHEKSNKG